jgi:hypothetical protein
VLTPFIPQYVGMAPALVLIFQRRREKRILAAGVSS